MMKTFYLSLALLLGIGLQAHADNWMSRLPDNLYVAEVSIPGAHDAATGHGFADTWQDVGNRWARTQDIDIAAQWSIGIRAFDLRPQVDGDHLHMNHGIVPTAMCFDTALYLLRDSLIANPTEFVVIHLLYADGFSEDQAEYKALLLELLQSDELKDYLVDFRRDLTVGQMRGKILLASRDEYDTKPIGGFLKNWCGYIDWSAQTSGIFQGPGTGSVGQSPLYMQDLSDTHEDGQIEAKVQAIYDMLDYSTGHKATSAYNVTWVFNFASGYSLMDPYVGNQISLSDGYRDNATYTNAAFIDYLKEHNGPTGIVLADYVGVDESEGYATRGQELVDTLIANNFKYLERRNQEKKAEAMEQIEALYDSLEQAKEVIAAECPDVAADYSGQLEELANSFAALQQEVDSLCEGWLLTEGYSIGYSSLERSIGNIVKEALEAQEEYDNTHVGIEEVKADEDKVPVRFFTPRGEQVEAPQRGNFYIVEYSDGTVEKKFY